MKKFKFVLVLITLLVFARSADAQTYTGCLVNGKIYTEDNTRTSGSGSDYAYSGANYALGGMCDNGNTSTCTVTEYVFVIFPVEHAGIKSSYSLLNCPIDDYAWLLTAVIGAVGVFFLRKRNFLLLS